MEWQFKRHLIKSLGISDKVFGHHQVFLSIYKFLLFQMVHTQNIIVTLQDFSTSKKMAEILLKMEREQVIALNLQVGGLMLQTDLLLT